MKAITNSRLEGLRDLMPNERLQTVAQAANTDIAALGGNVLGDQLANGMIENVIGKFELPLGVATNFVVNGKDYLIPMAVEEPSVVAAASYMARIARESGGFTADADDPIMRAQIQVLRVPDLEAAKTDLAAAEPDLIKAANEVDTVLVQLGGGCRGIEVHSFPDTPVGPMLVVHLLVDVRDAMGANAVNSMAERLAPSIASIAQGDVRLRILSNLADKRLVRARVRIDAATLKTSSLSGNDVAQGIVEACALALVDPYRAATHNKGIMNGIDPVVLATGNDWRAIEAGAHAFAAQSGRYTSLTRWELKDGFLEGKIELPMALGLVGGATKTHPAAQAAIKLLDVSSSSELSQVAASVGLAQNMAALRALATEGIQKGHMALHARNIAIAAGAVDDQIDEVARKIVQTGEITVAHAKTLLQQR
ncbi:hydroxymethylglutaryl-CoA reductase, degradative [Lentilitoribacter sp. EG35]|uniref:hydroxymethylglutaryl-CoA reductase, degradative n=1 Tax=Lentilitoribacter sp. EG35 TaxID=3234192 RepID=UPI003460ADCB